MTRLEENIDSTAWEKLCSVCGEEYVNVGHPLKPGVIMMLDCACVRETQSHSGINVASTIITTRAPTPDERAKWRLGYGKV